MVGVLTCGMGERGEAASGGATRNGGSGRAASLGSSCGRGRGLVRARTERGDGGGGARASNQVGTHRQRQIAATDEAEGRVGDGARVWLGRGNDALNGRGRRRRAGGHGVNPRLWPCWPNGREWRHEEGGERG
jgi:hypothetical protein